MKIGVISDTHDNLPKIKQAVESFNAHQVEFVIHAGDFVAPFSLIPFKEGLKCEWVGVFGNNDGEKEGLINSSQERIKLPPYTLTIGSYQIVVMHKWEEVSARIIVFGHTHKVHIQKQGKLILNPGEACGWLTGQSSLIILNLEKLEPEVIYF